MVFLSRNAQLQQFSWQVLKDLAFCSVRTPEELPAHLSVRRCAHRLFAMTSGITVTSNPQSALLQSLGVTSWPTWGCGVSTFPWTYDEQETCLLLEGDVTVTPDGGEPVRFGAGDLVVFDAGLSCTWDVHAPVRKHYRFG